MSTLFGTPIPTLLRCVLQPSELETVFRDMKSTGDKLYFLREQNELWVRSENSEPELQHK